MTLSLIIDPGGEAGVRDGLNLEVFPESMTETREKLVQSRTANSALVISSRGALIDLEWVSLLTQEEFDKIDALVDYNVTRASQGFTTELVVYNLFQPYSEIAPTRSRFIVPGTSVITADSLGSVMRLKYYVAMQGTLETTWERTGDCFLVSFTFTEGTRLTSSMET